MGFVERLSKTDGTTEKCQCVSKVCYELPEILVTLYQRSRIIIYCKSFVIHCNSGEIMAI